MSEIEKIVSEQIKEIVPTFDKLEVSIIIDDNSYSVEFFVTKRGERMQCFDMVDSGLLKENEVSFVSKEIAKRVRQSSTYVRGEINDIAVTVEEQN